MSTAAVQQRVGEAPGVSGVDLPDAVGARRTEVPLPSRAQPRPGRRTGRGLRPQARPPRVAVVGRAAPGGSSRGCEVGPSPLPQAPPARPVDRTWQITDRGIALILVTAAMIATAALFVVTLTAVRVTGERYQTGPAQGGVQAGQLR